MLNKSHDQHIAIYNNVAPAQASNNNDGNIITAIAGLVIVASTVVVMCLVVWQVAIRLIDALVTLLSSLIAVLPWLAGMAVVAVLVYWFLRSLPEAIDEVQEMRYRRMIARQRVLMLEQKDAHYTVVDSIAARIEAE